MDAFSVTASVIAVLQLSTKVCGYLNDVRDASKDRAKCAIEVANLNSLLTAFRFRLEEGDSSTPWYIAVRKLATENGPLDQFRQALEQLEKRITGKDKIGKVGSALVWKFKKDEIAGILGRMERVKTLIEVALQMDHFKLSQAMKQCGDATRKNTELIRDDTIFIRHEAGHAQHGKLMAWLSPTDFPAQQSDIIGRRHQGTGQWFLDSPEFARWLEEPKGTIFCLGMPGAGKTMIAAVAVEHLFKKVQTSSIGVAYVYCNYKAREEQGIESLLAAILKQLVQAQSSLMEPVEILYRQHVHRGTNPSCAEIFAALRHVLTEYSAVHVVIDAVDECRDSDGTRRLFLARLRDLQAKTDFRIMVTSRAIPDIINEFKTALRLEVRASDEDVNRYIAGQIYRLPRCIQRDPTLQDMVQDKITQTVGGMFLLARLYIDSLLDRRTPKEVKATLTRLSRGSNALDDAYKDAIQRIESQLSGDLELAKKVLSWITCAKRPLSTAEICCALAVEPNEEKLDPENVPDIEDLVSVCAGLVVVDPISAVIRLVHYTAQEYFEGIMKQWRPRALLEITLTCLTYLCFDTFKSGGCATDEEFEHRLQKYSFLDYAAIYWGEHALTVQGEAYRPISAFLVHEGLISCAVQVLTAPIHKTEGYSQEYPRGVTSLHLAAHFGLSLVSEKIMPHHNDEIAIAVSSKDSLGQTPLHFASSHGHDEMTKLLLDKGSSVNAQDKKGYCALQNAVERGHTKTVKLLLGNGADVDQQGGHFGTACITASFHNNSEIVQILIDNGADFNAQGGCASNSALGVASKRGHEQTAKVLLKNGADVNAQVGCCGTVLQIAAMAGHEHIVRLLLDNGADIDLRRGYLGNALEMAGATGHIDVVKLLLKAGCDPTTVDCAYGPLMNLLAFNGRTNILRIIYDQYYKSPLIIDLHDRTPLQVAARGGHLNAFEYLLGVGFDPAITDAKGENLLHYASSGGSMEILDAVLHMDCISRTQREQWSPIHWACRKGNSRIVEVLIKEGFQSHSVTVLKPDGRWSPISIALFHGNGEMLKDLSDNTMTLLNTDEKAARLCGKRDNYYWCSGCYHDIYGPRFRCRTCPSIDYCFMCKPFLSHLHEDHEWDCFEPPVED